MRLYLSAAAAAIVSVAVAAAEEGKWLPDQTGALAYALKEAGLEIDPKALSDLSAAPLSAIVSLGGCSAAFLSPNGLIATNHHCIYGSIQYNSTPKRNLLESGFLAKSFGEELPAAPGTRAYVIEALKDVTAEMNVGVSDSLSGLDRHNLMEKNRKTLIAACEEQESRRCDIRAYYGGAKYYLQRQLENKDVRLVYAPPRAIGNFGGEVDNWQWPRHTGDFGFYRAYVAPDGASRPFDTKNVPYKSAAYLKIAKAPVEEGDLVMVAGFPGSTDRLRTAAEAEFHFSTYYPRQQQLLSSYADAIMKATAGNEATTIKYANALRSADNIKKKLLGQMAGADAVRLSDSKRADEREFRAWIASDKSRRAQYEASVGALDAVVAEANEALTVSQTLSLLNRAQLLSAARNLYRWAEEREKPDADRKIGFQDRDRQQTLERLTQIEKRFDPGVDRILFEQALAEYGTLKADFRDAAFEAMLAETPVDQLYARTRLADTKTRLQWLDRPVAEFKASDDPFIRLAVAMSPADRAREEKDDDRSGRMQKARSAYLAAMLEHATAKGRAIAPDANGSLRFTYGKVAGRARDGGSWAPFTTISGILDKNTGKPPFDAPAKLLAKGRAGDFGVAADRALGTLPVNFLSTVDITNGNSGLATLNARGEFVGLAFDGTMDGVISDWRYDPKTNRTIHVDGRYMLWVMEEIDGAGRLLREMGAE